MKTALFIIVLIAGLATSLFFIVKRKFQPDKPTGNVDAPDEDDTETKDELAKIDKEAKDAAEKINGYDTSTHAGGTALLRDYEKALGGKTQPVHGNEQPANHPSGS